MRDSLKRATLPRHQLITASDVPAILGMSPWTTAHDVWLAKNNPQPKESAAMRRGTAAEDVIHNWYAQFPLTIEEGLRYADAPIAGPVMWAAASPDAFAQDQDFRWYTVEYKTSSQPWYGGIPPHYLAQVRWQLICVPEAQYAVLVAVTGLPAEVDAMLGSEDPEVQEDGKSVLGLMLWRKVIIPQVFFVERNADEEQALLQQMSTWHMRHMEVGVEPVLTAKDLATVQRSWEALEPAGEVELGNDAIDGRIAALSAKLKAAEAYLKTAEEDAKTVRAELLAAWAETYPQADVLRLPNNAGKISYKAQQGRASLDGDRLRKDHPQLAAEYTKQGASFRVLRFGK